MKDYDNELDDILNKIDEDNKVIEASNENKNLIEELKKQKEILNNQIKEYHQLIDDTNTFYSKQNEIIEASDKYTKKLLDSINKVLDTSILLEQHEDGNNMITKLFDKLEKEIYKIHEQLYDICESCYLEKHVAISNDMKRKQKTLKILMLFVIISQILELTLVILFII